MAFALAAATIAIPARAFAQAPPRTVDVSDPQDGGMLSVFAGDTVRVELRATPSTGYSWQVVQVNKSVLVQRGNPTFKRAPEEVPGAEGHSVIDLLAATPGSCVLQLAYSRPWEKGSAPARTFSVDVTVRPASERPMPQF
ncbi:MAG TPA: protease inhibitor I42 family protein [Candidatus Binataceae bacterium]|nr:protease inhibitor I42 family protein [Candidatus Binataceae bacterium]